MISVTIKTVRDMYYRAVHICIYRVATDNKKDMELPQTGSSFEIIPKDSGGMQHGI